MFPPLARKRICSTLALMFLCFGLAPGGAWAGYVVTASGTDTDGPIAAKAVFTAGNGYIQVVLYNTQSGNASPGQSVSQFFFQVNGLSGPTGVSSVSGNTINFATNTAGTVTNGNPADYHWGFDTHNGVYALLDVSSGQWNGPPGQPQYMIIGPNAAAGPLQNSFNPFFNSWATFIVTDPGITVNTALNASDITNVQFGFGTGPETVLNGSQSPVVPAPPSIVLCAIGGIGFAGFLIVRSRRRQLAAA
jgi:hypothetical protein